MKDSSKPLETMHPSFTASQMEQEASMWADFAFPETHEAEIEPSLDGSRQLNKCRKGE